VGELLLLSNSTAPGMGFLEHAIEAIQDVLGGRASVLFVPFASSHPDTYATVMRDALARIGVRVTSLHEASDVAGAVRLRVTGRHAVLSGAGTGRLFRRHEEPADVPVGAGSSPRGKVAANRSSSRRAVASLSRNPLAPARSAS
jgi:hypothetical protein